MIQADDNHADNLQQTIFAERQQSKRQRTHHCHTSKTEQYPIMKPDPYEPLVM